MGGRIKVAIPRAVRRTIFWCHLIAGSIAGLVILVMSFTGVLLAYERQIERWADGYSVTPPTTGASRVSLDVMLANVRTAKPNAELSAMTISADPATPASVRLGRMAVVYVDPYTGRVLGEGSKPTHDFFKFIEGWHRWFGLGASKIRPVGKMINDAANLVFLFIVLSGLYLWWPRQWNVSALKRVVLFDWQLRGKARDFNWHNTIGVWTVLPLSVVVLSAVFMSYQWPMRTVNRVLGLPMSATVGRSGPSPDGVRTPRGERGDVGRDERPRAPRSEPRQTGEGQAGGEFGGRSAKPSMVLAPHWLDTLWTHAQIQANAWQSVNFRMPSDDDRTMTFTFDRGANSRPDQRVRVDVDIATGRVKPLPRNATGFVRQIPLWARMLHTGQAFGIVGQTIAMLASLGAVFLVWTGFALMLRRFAAWRARRARDGTALVSVTPTPVLE